MTLSERTYRFLIKAYPPSYRREYAEPMVQLFRDRLREAKSARAISRLWLQTAVDFAATLPARHLERLLPRHGAFRFSPEAGGAIYFARFEASSFARKEITLEHLLLGVLREDRKLARNLLSPVAVEAICQAIEANEANLRRIPPMEDLPLNGDAKAAISEAIQRGGTPVQPRDLLVGILQRETTLAARLLREHGVDLSLLGKD